ncbi:hypothetical protein [Sulfurimonas sp.]
MNEKLDRVKFLLQALNNRYFQGVTLTFNMYHHQKNRLLRLESYYANV